MKTHNNLRRLVTLIEVLPKISKSLVYMVLFQLEYGMFGAGNLVKIIKNLRHYQMDGLEKTFKKTHLYMRKTCIMDLEVKLIMLLMSILQFVTFIQLLILIKSNYFPHSIKLLNNPKVVQH